MDALITFILELFIGSYTFVYVFKLVVLPVPHCPYILFPVIQNDPSILIIPTLKAPDTI